jgi:hypothetical protein
VSKSTWLIGAVVALSALGIAGAFIRFRPCGSCGEIVQEVNGRLISGPKRYFPPLNCPDCDDQGKVSLFRSWRPSVSEPVRKIIHGLGDDSGKESIDALKALMPDGDASPHRGETLRSRFVRHDGRTYLALVMRNTFVAIPGTSTVTAVLVHSQGGVLDYVRLTCSSRAAILDGEILDVPAGDGMRIRITGDRMGTSLERAMDIPVELRQWQREVRQVVAPGAGNVCCLRIHK